MAETKQERLDRLRKKLSDRRAAYNALGSSGAGSRLVREIKNLEEAISAEEKNDDQG